MIEEKLKFSVLIPVFNMKDTVGDTIKSILNQTYQNFEIIVQDNDSTDDTESVVLSFDDARIKYEKNKKNIGTIMNLREGLKRCSGDAIYLMAADDILEKNALVNTFRAFQISDDIGAVTRPYYWFEKDVKLPIRAKRIINPNNNEVLNIESEKLDGLCDFLSTLDQLSGLAYRKKYMKENFRDDLWTCHGYPFLSVWKEHPVVFLKKYTTAIRVGSSGARTNIYQKSPMVCWIEMFNDVFSESKFRKIREKCIRDFVATNYVGLVQIKNYGSFKSLIREISYLIKYRPKNLINPFFWAFTLICLLVPVKLLIPFTDWYKKRINSKIISKIDFEFE